MRSSREFKWRIRHTKPHLLILIFALNIRLCRQSKEGNFQLQNPFICFFIISLQPPPHLVNINTLFFDSIFPRLFWTTHSLLSLFRCVPLKHPIFNSFIHLHRPTFDPLSMRSSSSIELVGQPTMRSVRFVSWIKHKGITCSLLQIGIGWLTDWLTDYWIHFLTSPLSCSLVPVFYRMR